MWFFNPKCFLGYPMDDIGQSDHGIGQQSSKLRDLDYERPFELGLRILKLWCREVGLGIRFGCRGIRRRAILGDHP